MTKSIDDNIFVSFSGGKTSAYMCKWIQDNHKENNLTFVFANTGQEHPKTYEFIRNVVDYFEIDLKIVEAKVTDKGTKHTVVTLDSLCTDGSLFEDVVKKYGIPNQGYPHCTRELKLQPMKSYVNSLLGRNNYTTAIGIRADEIDRMNSNYEKLKYYYPLVKQQITKLDINNYWEAMPFTLEIPEHLGNCTWCWKKSFKKHLMVIEEMPEAYDVPKYLEDKYKINNLETQKRKGNTQVFFRTQMSANDLFEHYNKTKLTEAIQEDLFDNYENSCQESCEPL